MLGLVAFVAATPYQKKTGKMVEIVASGGGARVVNNLWSRPFEKHIGIKIPCPGEPGAFAAIRKYDIHTGVDLYCQPGTKVFAVEQGIVIFINYFTGPESESPWWNSTKAIMVKGESGVVLYGEINPQKEYNIGCKIKRGEHIGNTLPVIRRDKGAPTCMLHIELYKASATECTDWKLNELQPELLLDPSGQLLESLTL